ASRGLVVGISSKRPTAAKLVGRAVPCTPSRKSRRTALTVATQYHLQRARSEAPYQTYARSVGRAVLCPPRLAQECEAYRLPLRMRLIRRNRLSASRCCNFQASLRR